MANPRAWLKHEALQDALVIVLLVALFLREPIAKLGTHAYTSADLAQDCGIARVEADYGPRNVLLADPALQMLPWQLFNARELGAGRVPLWNPYNGNGTPHLANDQSAPFSPFNWPFYVLRLDVALLVVAFAKLALLAFAMRMFLRELGLARAAALVGATTFAFSGYDVLLLAYPHSSVACVLPLAFWCIERGVGRREFRASAIGIGATVALGLFAGQGEPLYFVALLAAAYALARLASLGPRPALRVGALWIGAALLGAGVAAVQLLPFVDYLLRSALWHERALGQPTLGLPNWPLWFQPDLLGSPSTSWLPARDLPSPIYAQVNAVYVGATVIVLALVSLRGVFRDARRAFFACAALTWLAYAYDIFGVSRIAGWIPLLTHAPPARSSLVGVFVLATCAAFGTEELLRRRSLALAGGAVAVALIAACTYLVGADALLERTLAALPDSGSPEAFERVAVGGSRWVLAWLGAAALAMFVAASIPHRSARAAASVVLVASVFAQTGELLRGYNPTVERRFVYPRTRPLARLGEIAGQERVLVATTDALLPDANLAWSVAMPTSYDALGLRHHEELLARVAGDSERWRLPRFTSERFLQLFGVRYVLVRGAWPEVGTLFPELRLDARAALVPLPLGRASVQQRFRAPADLDAVALWISSAASPATLEIQLLDARERTTLVTTSVTASALAQSRPDAALDRFGAQGVRSIQMRLPGRARASELELVLRASDEESFAAWLRPGLVPRDVTPTSGGTLVFDASTAFDDLTPVAEPRGHTLYRYERSLGRAWTVDACELTADASRALERVASDEFDPARAVVLLDAPHAEISAESSRPAREVVPERDIPGESVYRVSDDAPSVLVTTHTFDPGWRAEVDGARTPVSRANYAFCGVVLPPGEHVVRLVYAPLSFTLGLWITVASFAAALVLVTRSRPTRRAP